MSADDIAALERTMDAAAPAQWLPAFKKALDESSRHGTGPSPLSDDRVARALDKAIALAPADWELLCVRGSLRAGRSDFDGARTDFDKAASLAPGSPRPFSERVYLHTRQGDWTSALADLDRAASLSGGQGRGLDRGLVLLSLGRAAEARAEFAKSTGDPEARFHLGRSLLVEGKHEEALAALRQALAQSGPDSSRRRSYELLAAVAETAARGAASGASAPGETFMKDARKKSAKDGKGCLWLFGVGIDRPYEITMNTIMALKRCDVVYTQAETREMRELLEAVHPRVQTIACAGAGKDPQELVWKSVKAELDRGSQTAYVTYGHPMLFGEGNAMAKRCKQAGYSYRVTTAPSSIDGILTMLQDDLDLCERGFLVSNARGLLEPGAGVEPSTGAIILGINRLMEIGEFGKFCGLLEAAYPKDHPVYGLKCADGYRDETRVSMTVGELRGRERSLDPALTLFVPAAGEAKTPRKKASR